MFGLCISSYSIQQWDNVTNQQLSALTGTVTNTLRSALALPQVGWACMAGSTCLEALHKHAFCSP